MQPPLHLLPFSTSVHTTITFTALHIITSHSHALALTRQVQRPVHTYVGDSCQRRHKYTKPAFMVFEGRFETMTHSTMTNSS